MRSSDDVNHRRHFRRDFPRENFARDGRMELFDVGVELLGVPELDEGRGGGLLLASFPVPVVSNRC